MEIIFNQFFIKVYPCFCIHLDTKDRITHILFVHKYIYARIDFMKPISLENYAYKVIEIPRKANKK